MIPEEINNSYRQNIALAFRIGMNVPRIIYFEKAPVEEMQEIEENSRYWRLKPNFAIEKKKGMRVTYTCYYNGSDITFTTSSIHRRNILAGGLGEELAENLVTVFHNHKCIIADKFDAIIEVFPDYRGIIQIETLIDNSGEVWYEDIRFGSNLEYFICLARLHCEDAEMFNIEDATFVEGFATGCSVYRFPNVGVTDLEKDFIYPGSITGFAVNSDSKVRESWKGLYAKLKEIDDICYRNDGGRKEEKQWHTMKKRSLV
jgi:hypothetical protein